MQASCGCTTPTWSKEPIKPGAQGSVTAIYNSKGRPGNFNKAVTVTSNAKTAQKVLFIKGNVEAAAAAASLAWWGRESAKGNRQRLACHPDPARRNRRGAARCLCGAHLVDASHEFNAHTSRTSEMMLM